MARLTLARKIAAITLHIWKKGVRFDAPEITSSLSVSDRVRSIPGIFSGGGHRVLGGRSVGGWQPVSIPDGRGYPWLDILLMLA
jgi:hypothetical protein